MDHPYMRWHVRVPLSIRPCLRSTLRACNISRADSRPPMAAAWQDAHTSVASRSEPSRAFEFPLLSAVFSSLFSFASEDDRDRKRRARARATLESMPLPLDLARRLRPKQSRTVVVSASSFGTGSFRRQRINALGSEAPWSDDSQENVARGRPWFSLARWFDFFSKRSDKPKGSLVVNEDFTRDAARRVGRLLSAEIDQAMFLLLPAAFYSYLLSVLLQMFWTEPEYFWYRWISENSANTTTSLEFRNMREVDEVCVRRIHTPSFYAETRCPGFKDPEGQISWFIIFLVILVVFAIFCSMFWLKYCLVFCALRIKRFYLWARGLYLHRRQEHVTSKRATNKVSDRGYLSDEEEEEE